MTHRSLRGARKRLGWSQQRAAAATGVSQTYLSMLETGTRALPPDLARKLVRVYGLSPTLLPPTVGRWTPSKVDSQALAEYLAALDYPGFAYLRRRRPRRNPAEVLLAALAQVSLEARLVEALPWLLLKYWNMDTVWLVEQAKLHDLQNRLGFVATLARKTAQKASAADPKRDAVLENLESSLRLSVLAREDTLGQPSLSNAERTWLKKHRPREARQWNLLTDWRPEALRYVA